MPARITIVFLTFNSSRTIATTVSAARRLSDDIHCVDSFSSDGTLDIVRALGCRVLQHEFTDYGSQRNWAIDNIPTPGGWQLHLDSDEELTPALIDEIQAIDLETAAFDGFMLRRQTAFMGKVLRWGGVATTWHYRLFRTGFGRCESRRYDQHFVPSGRTGFLKGRMIDHNIETITEWTARHNRWASMEAEEIVAERRSVADQLQPDAFGLPSQRKRYMKMKYYALPLFWRAGFYFLYRFLFHLAFLDGIRGVIYCVLQSFWFRFLVDVKIHEIENPPPLPSPAGLSPARAER